ncbi:hypothetical protein ABB55_14670 [Prosthecomicrobium hirschii]|uniref:Dihydrolipoyl dehydrogenase n=1 Tax=Prosthecodimorpha hirschii TaxID=665126 RepID=A0A0P6VN75_9HYPH|nr:dihydrolipoyl dehydrogenase [Prosthecomicrobium hirschii]KPL53301.1 hypothetical protein ABB55_14670 [Prosthecomicrobium hirschii]
MTEIRTLLVVGGGIGGYTAAIRAARAGLAVTLVEDGPLGGTCLNVGCIPSKSLLGSAAAHADRVGRSAGRADLAPIMARKTAAVARLVGGVQTLIRRNRIDHVAERAELLGPGRLRLAGSGRVLVADAVILATGSRPARPAIPGLELPGVLDSDAAIALDTVPERLLVLGGGVIGMELAQVFADLGARVAVVERAERILPGEDAGAVAVLAAAMRRRGVAVTTGATVERLARRDGALVATLTDAAGAAREVVADRVLVAVGRVPETGVLGDDPLGLRGPGGVITVDDHGRTRTPGIFAVGDVCGGPQLAHKAAAEAEVAVATLLGRPASRSGRVVPRAVYTTPEIAAVGLDAATARTRGPVKVGRFPFSANGRAIAGGHDDGFVEIVADAVDEQILGIVMVGHGVTELLGEATLAVQMELTLAALAETVHAHPTLSEALAEAAHDARDGGAIHLPPRPRTGGETAVAGAAHP